MCTVLIGLIAGKPCSHRYGVNHIIVAEAVGARLARDEGRKYTDK
jgi:hypothetical protein